MIPVRMMYVIVVLWMSIRRWMYAARVCLYNRYHQINFSDGIATIIVLMFVIIVIVIVIVIVIIIILVILTTGVLEKNTPPEKKTRGKLTYKNTKTGAG